MTATSARFTLTAPARLVSLTLATCFAASAASAQPARSPAPPAPPVAAPPTPNPAQPPAPATPLPHVEVSGTGPVPVVLIPGLACDWTVFKSFMARNAPRYTMHAVTLPGFGGSQPPPVPAEATGADDVWLTNAERAIVQYVLKQKLDRPVVIGHSLGGQLAYRLAARHSEYFRAGVSLDGLPAFPLAPPGTPFSKEQRRVLVNSQVWPSMKVMTDAQWAEQTRSTLTSWVKDQARAKELGDLCAAVPGAVAGRYLTELFASDASEDLANIKLPFLAIAAISDADQPGARREDARQVWGTAFARFPGLQLVIFENTRHFVTEDAPAELDRAIEQFVAGKPVEGRKAAP